MTNLQRRGMLLEMAHVEIRLQHELMLQSHVATKRLFFVGFTVLAIECFSKFKI